MRDKIVSDGVTRRLGEEEGGKKGGEGKQARCKALRWQETLPSMVTEIGLNEVRGKKEKKKEKRWSQGRWEERKMEEGERITREIVVGKDGMDGG